MPPAIIFHGAGDTTVRPENGPLVAGQWLACRTASGTDRIARSRRRDGHAPDGRAYAVTSWYTTRGRAALELWQVTGLAHAWSGGTAGGSFSDPHGPSASTGCGPSCPVSAGPERCSGISAPVLSAATEYQLRS